MIITNLNRTIILFCLIVFKTLQSSGQRLPLPECKFKVIVEKTYFYNSSTGGPTGVMTKRKGYLTKGDIVWTVCKYSDDKYVYVKFKNKKGQVTKGLICSSDLEELNP